MCRWACTAIVAFFPIKMVCPLSISILCWAKDPPEIRGSLSLALRSLISLSRLSTISFASLVGRSMFALQGIEPQVDWTGEAISNAPKGIPMRADWEFHVDLNKVPRWDSTDNMCFVARRSRTTSTHCHTVVSVRMLLGGLLG